MVIQMLNFMTMSTLMHVPRLKFVTTIEFIKTSVIKHFGTAQSKFKLLHYSIITLSP